MGGTGSKASHAKGLSPQRLKYLQAIEHLSQLADRKCKGIELIEAAFPKQRTFIKDPSKLKAAQTTRRAGKTYGGVLFLLEGALLSPGSISPYIALTRDSAKRICWPILAKINDAHNLNAEMKESALSMVLPNKSELFLIGADQKGFIDRLRGVPYRRAVVDEGGSFGAHLESLIDDVLTPSLADYDGELAMIGTPVPRPYGYFHDVTKKLVSGWSVHRWSVLDNPHMPNIKDFIAELMQRRGWSSDHPTYRREWLGEWVMDMDALVYRFSEELNTYKDRPKEDWHYVIGADFGYEDDTAFTVLAYSGYHPKLYVVKCERHNHMIPSNICKRMKELMEEYSPVSIVGDTGGLGKSIVEEMRQRYAIPITAAEKRNKLANIELLNGDFISGNVMVHDSLTELREQYSILTKGDNGMEDPTIPNDLCDATLYAYMECRHWANSRREPKVDVNSDKFMEQLWQQEAEQLERQEQLEWWET